MSTSYPIDHPLYSARAKVKRANSHIEAFRRSARSTLDPQASLTVVGEYEGDHPLRGTKLVRLDIAPNVKSTWGLIVGDVVTNLRSALDHVAWSLAQKQTEITGTRPTPDEERGITFPLRENAPAIGKSFQINKYILPSAKTTIERFQPYNRPKWPELVLLAVLDDLSRSDKHRLVISTRRQVSIRLGADDPMTFMGLDKPTSERFLMLPERYDLEPYFSFDEVVHNVGGLPGFSLGQLHLIHDFIRDEVLPAFAGFFK